MIEKKAREIALENGHASYMSDKPCINGHLSKRSTVYGNCYKCIIEAQKRNIVKRKELLEIGRQKQIEKELNKNG